MIDSFIKFILWFIVFLIVINFIYIMNTEFEKEITIKEKYIATSYSRYSSTPNYFIVSSDNKTYTIVNLWWKGEFDNSDDYAKLNVGETYRVKGYGIRIPLLSMHPNIYTIGK